MFVGTRCYETFPRMALLKKFQLSAYFPKNCAKVGTQKLCDFLMECNEGLDGEIRPIDVQRFPTSHPRFGARIVILSGTQEFLDSLQRFPKDFPFDIQMANVYIRGGTRTDEARGKPRQPKIKRGAMEELVRRNIAEILKQQTATLKEDDTLAKRMDGTTLNPENFPVSKIFPNHKLTISKLSLIHI